MWSRSRPRAANPVARAERCSSSSGPVQPSTGDSRYSLRGAPARAGASASVDAQPASSSDASRRALRFRELRVGAGTRDLSNGVLVDQDLLAPTLDHDGEAIEALELADQVATGGQLDRELLRLLEVLEQEPVLDVDVVLGHQLPPLPSRDTNSITSATRRSTSGQRNQAATLSLLNQVSCRFAYW